MSASVAESIVVGELHIYVLRDPRHGRFDYAWSWAVTEQPVPMARVRNLNHTYFLHPTVNRGLSMTKRGAIRAARRACRRHAAAQRDQLERAVHLVWERTYEVES